MNIQQALAKVVEGNSLEREEMQAVMHQIMAGDATDAQIGGLLVALRMKGETTSEIAGAAQVMRELATPVNVSDPHLVDLVGTGGDGANLFNVSTGASFVAAAAGAKVAKHGNRSVSSTSGSSDVLENLGMPLDLGPDQVGRAIMEVGVGFMFAPAHHSAMRHAVGPRRELGIRTMFNILGPLTNPAGVKRQVIGVFSADLCQPIAEVLKMLGAEHAMVVHSNDGLDEISIAAGTQVTELQAFHWTSNRRGIHAKCLFCTKPALPRCVIGQSKMSSSWRTGAWETWTRTRVASRENKLMRMMPVQSVFNRQPARPASAVSKPSACNSSDNGISSPCGQGTKT